MLGGWGGSQRAEKKVMAAYRLVYGFSHLRVDCRGSGLAPEGYARFKYGTTFIQPTLLDITPD